MLDTIAPDDEVLVVVGPEARGDLSSEITSGCGDDPRVRIVDDGGEFSFSDRVNVGVGASGGEVVLLLNDDTEVLSQDWLDVMARGSHDPPYRCCRGHAAL